MCCIQFSCVFFLIINNIKYFIFKVVAPVVAAKLVILGILFLTSFILKLSAVVVVAGKLVRIGIYFLTSFVLALKVVLVSTLVMSGILSSIFLF